MLKRRGGCTSPWTSIPSTDFQEETGVIIKITSHSPSLRCSCSCAFGSRPSPGDSLVTQRLALVGDGPTPIDEVWAAGGSALPIQSDWRAFRSGFRPHTQEGSGLLSLWVCSRWFYHLQCRFFDRCRAVGCKSILSNDVNSIPIQFPNLKTIMPRLVDVPQRARPLLPTPQRCYDCVWQGSPGMIVVPTVTGLDIFFPR